MPTKDWTKKAQVAFEFRTMKSLGLLKPTKRGKRGQYNRMMKRR